ncbi:MAG: hypothetical protein M3Y31_08380 [Gemmatimonadota bacterium]|nr:hypothetical protein [Gemmatimonadota bacterium]
MSLRANIRRLLLGAVAAVGCGSEPAAPSNPAPPLSNGVYPFSQTVAFRVPGQAAATCTSEGALDLQIVSSPGEAGVIIGRLERLVTCERGGVNFAGYEDLSQLSGSIDVEDVTLAEPDARILGSCEYSGVLAPQGIERVAGGTVTCTRTNAEGDVVATADGTWGILSP